MNKQDVIGIALRTGMKDLPARLENVDTADVVDAISHLEDYTMQAHPRLLVAHRAALINLRELLRERMFAHTKGS